MVEKFHINPASYSERLSEGGIAEQGNLPVTLAINGVAKGFLRPTPGWPECHQNILASDRAVAGQGDGTDRVYMDLVMF